MNFLPIVTRELRVAARRKATYRMRWLTALITMVISLGLLSIFNLFQTPQLGAQLFAFLSYYLLGLCALAGIFLTSDTLSEEKREGTLGLLFLTDLKGYDVILGKFMATSLNAFYGLLAVFPIIALPLMVGGVTGGEFWRMNLALANMLFFSLATGMWISARTRDAQRAMALTFGILLLFGALLPLLGQLQATFKLSGFLWNITTLSPLITFLTAFDSAYKPSQFWSSLGTSHFLAWLFLALASRVVPRSWQDKPLSSSREKRWANWNFGGRDQNAKTRAKLLEENPILWLMGGGTQLRWTIWILALLVVTVSVVMQHFILDQSGTPAVASAMASSWLMWPFLLLIKILIAVRASLFFAESRRSGAVELLLATPLSNREIVRGQWLGLKRLFLGPIVLIVATQLVMILLSLVSFEKTWDYFMALFFSGGVGIYGVFKFVMDVLAIVWLGLWMGISCRKPNRAPVWTILLAIVLPSVAFCVPDIAIDLFLILWCRSKLELDLRAYLAGDLARLRPGKNYNENFGIM